MDMPFERPRLPSAGLQCRLPQALWCEPISVMRNISSSFYQHLNILEIDINII